MPQHTTEDVVERVEDIVNTEANKEYKRQFYHQFDMGDPAPAPDYFQIWLNLYDTVIKEFQGGKDNPPRRK